MAFEELREQLKDKASEALAKIQENSTYNTVREKYESQTPTMQKVYSAAALGAVMLFFFYIAYSFVASSSESLAQFEENRELIQGLLRASRSAKEPPPLPPPMPPDALRSQVDALVRGKGLIPEQIGEMNQIPDNELKGLAPPDVIVNGITVQLKKLNVKQVLDLSNETQNMGLGIKLLGIDVVQTAGTTHYYDTTLQLASFGLPNFDTGGDADTGSGKKTGGKGKAKAKDADLEAE